MLELWKEAGSTLSVSDDLETLERHFIDQPGLLLVAFSGSKLLGTVMGSWDGWRGNICRLAVRPEYRRKGIGKALVGEVERRLWALGARKISILVEKDDELALSFWNAMEKNDYRVDTRITRFTRTLEADD